MLQLFYASDVHGSDVLWRKFVNAGKFYGVDVLVMGGDIAGKAVVPIVRRDGGFVARQVAGDRVFNDEELPTVEKRIRDLGFYPLQMSEAELKTTEVDSVFARAMAEGLEAWLRLAEERLDGSGIRIYVMLGNDDEPALRDVLGRSPVVVDPEDVTVELGEGLEMLSCGHANPTPWNSPRELPEDELERHLEQLVGQVQDAKRTVFNLHVPPIGTAIDRAAELDASLKPVVRGGAVQMIAAGSQAVRNVIERYQPPLALHGHIHESRGVVRIGKTVCINPGSEYSEGVLHGALVALDQKKGLRNYQLVSG